MNVYVIYVHPSDAPDKYVTRLWVLLTDDEKKQAVLMPTTQAWAFDTEAEAKRVVPRTAEWFGREATDDPVIIETWVDWVSYPDWMMQIIAEQQAEKMKAQGQGNRVLKKSH